MEFVLLSTPMRQPPYGVCPSLNTHAPATGSPTVRPHFEEAGTMLLHFSEVLEDSLSRREGKERTWRVEKQWGGGREGRRYDV